MARPDLLRSPAEIRERFVSEEGCRRHLVACWWPAWFASTAVAPMEGFQSLLDLTAWCGPTTHKMLYAAEPTG